MSDPSRPNRPRRLTAEVQAALEARGLAPVPDLPPPLPDGHVRYHVAIENEAHLQGSAPRATVATQLRAIADQLDPPARA